MRDWPRPEPLRAVPQPADDERHAQDQQAVGEDRADQRRLDHDHQPGLEAEEPDEQLRQVAQRRLEDPRDGRALPRAQLRRSPRPTSEASIARATAVAPNVITGVPPPATRTAETTVATIAAPSRKRVCRSK